MFTQCIVLTTINPPNKIIKYYSSLRPTWTLIVVADTKTPATEYMSVECEFLSLEKQRFLYPDLYALIPFNSYCRKNFGYLFAVQNGCTLMFETDDDNLNITPLPNVPSSIDVTVDAGFINIYRSFTDEFIWPRGLPASERCVSETPRLQTKDTPPIAVVQGLVNKDPDVDAIWRVLSKHKPPFYFDKTRVKPVALKEYSLAPFNSQNTCWTTRSTFDCLYLPSTVSFRHTDILRGWVALFQLWQRGFTVMFTRPTAVQDRNEHDLWNDMQQELEVYRSANSVVALLDANKQAPIEKVYQILVDHHIVQQSEVDILKCWLKYLNRCATVQIE